MDVLSPKDRSPPSAAHQRGTQALAVDPAAPQIWGERGLRPVTWAPANCGAGSDGRAIASRNERAKADPTTESALHASK